jgi:hypothetical protein
MAGRVARVRNSKTQYAVKHGENVGAVEHVLDVFSSSDIITYKYYRISSSLSICTLNC